MFENTEILPQQTRYELALPEGYSLRTMMPDDVEVVFKKLGKELWPN